MPQATAAKKTVEKKQSTAKKIKQLALQPRLHWEGKKKNNNLPVQRPPHAFHALCKKIKNNQPAQKTKEKNGFSRVVTPVQTPHPLPLQQ